MTIHSSRVEALMDRIERKHRGHALAKEGSVAAMTKQYHAFVNSYYKTAESERRARTDAQGYKLGRKLWSLRKEIETLADWIVMAGGPSLPMPNMSGHR